MSLFLIFCSKNDGVNDSWESSQPLRSQGVNSFDCDLNSSPSQGCWLGSPQAEHPGAGLQERLEGRWHDERGDLHQYDPVSRAASKRLIKTWVEWVTSHVIVIHRMYSKFSTKDKVREETITYWSSPDIDNVLGVFCSLKLPLVGLSLSRPALKTFSLHSPTMWSHLGLILLCVTWTETEQWKPAFSSTC